ncbi:MAG TPA: threonine ammonia-lyase [Geopsychrobacteraceae bacterium]|nr:threonine ammonia-lyase [Geopsychrobacteraceae bacterium]
MLDIHQIESAAARLEGRFRHTELIHSPYYSARLETPLYFKCENLQETGSFKIRGAYNFLANQPAELLKRGVITASAGNHAQGVALSAALLGCTCTVVMPEETPLAKELATVGYGAKVIVHGSSFDDAARLALDQAQKRGLLYVPAFDDPLIMAGQGTVGLEIVHALPELETIIVPIGGGGLIAGIATVVKELCPSARVVGVEAQSAACAKEARRKGSPVDLSSARSLADGIAMKRIGEQTFPIIEALVDEIVTVQEEDIAMAIVSLMEKGKMVVEGAGAVGLAAMLYGGKSIHDGLTVCVLSGGNLDVQTMSRVVERGMLAEGRYLKLRLEMADVPGSLAQLSTLLSEMGANIFQVNHDRHNALLPLGEAEVRIELETRGASHIRDVLQALEEGGYRPEVVR